MYRKTHTEVTITKTVPAVPVPVPIPLPINSRNADTTMSVQCDDCTDTGEFAAILNYEAS